MESTPTLTFFCMRTYRDTRTTYGSLCRAGLNAGFHITNPRQLGCEVRDFLVTKLAPALWTDKNLRSPTQIAAALRLTNAFKGAPISTQQMIASVRRWIKSAYPNAKPLQRKRVTPTQPNPIHGHLKRKGTGGRMAGRYIIDTVTIFKAGLQNCKEEKFKIQLCVDSLISLAYFYPVTGLTPEAANKAFDYIYSDIRMYEQSNSMAPEYAMKSITSDCGLEFNDDFKSTDVYQLEHNYSDPGDKVFTFLLDSVTSVLQKSLRQTHGIYGSRADPNRITGSTGITVDAVSDVIDRINRTPKPFLRAALGRDCSPLEVTNEDRARISEYLEEIKREHTFQKGEHKRDYFDWTVKQHSGKYIMRSCWEYSNWNPEVTCEITDRVTDHELVGIKHEDKQLFLERTPIDYTYTYRTRTVLVQRYIRDTNNGLGGVGSSSHVLDQSRVYRVEGTRNGSLILRQLDYIDEDKYGRHKTTIESRLYQVKVVYSTRFLTLHNAATIIPPTRPVPGSLVEKIASFLQ